MSSQLAAQPALTTLRVTGHQSAGSPRRRHFPCGTQIRCRPIHPRVSEDIDFASGVPARQLRPRPSAPPAAGAGSGLGDCRQHQPSPPPGVGAGGASRAAPRLRPSSATRAAVTDRGKPRLSLSIRVLGAFRQKVQLSTANLTRLFHFYVPVIEKTSCQPKALLFESLIRLISPVCRGLFSFHQCHYYRVPRRFHAPHTRDCDKHHMHMCRRDFRWRH
jgi:hypothetical protein